MCKSKAPNATPRSSCNRLIQAACTVGLIFVSSSNAFAYRPFDGTDAAVADPGEVEIELQPAGAQWSREQNLLIAPAVVYNYGLRENWEAVLEGQLQTPFSPSGPTSLSASGAFLKNVVRPGVLQDNSVFCCLIAMERVVSVQVLPPSCRNDGIGERLI